MLCQQWNTFAAFLADMGERPPGLTLERIKVNEGYSPENCRWATRQDQSRNRRDTIMLTSRGVTKSLAIWADELQIKAQTIYMRLRRGLSDNQALAPEVSLQRRTTNRFITYDGKTLPIYALASITGISRKTLTLRVFYGWPDEKIITTPLRGRRT